MTVFTRNIDTILVKKIKRAGPATIDDASTTFSPISFLTGGATTATALWSKASTGGVAWRKPLQDTLLAKTTATNNKVRSKESSKGKQQRKTVALLEEHLGLRPTGADQSDVSHSSKSSRSSKISQKTATLARSKTSQSSVALRMTAASAHSRVDKLEASLQEITKMLKSLTALSVSETTQSPAQPSPSGTVLVLLQFLAAEIHSGEGKANDAKIRRILQLLNSERLQKPIRSISSSLSAKRAGEYLNCLFPRGSVI
jgi:hypothetical protein